MSIKVSICIVFLFTILHVGASECIASTIISANEAPIIQKHDAASDAFCPIVPSEVPRIQADELKSRLNDPALIVIDVRTDEDWNNSQAKIKGAVRQPAKAVSDWASTYTKDQTIVLYCS
jgi:hypothetical protein